MCLVARSGREPVTFSLKSKIYTCIRALLLDHILALKKIIRVRLACILFFINAIYLNRIHDASYIPTLYDNNFINTGDHSTYSYAQKACKTTATPQQTIAWTFINLRHQGCS